MRAAAFVLCASLLAIDATACAIFTLTRGNQVLMGNNEDYVKPGVIWFQPGRRGNYGRVNVGFDDKFAQGSMNEKGLAFDSAALNKIPWDEDPDKETQKNLIELIMNECATVAEAVGYFERYNCKHLADAQFMFADASGASAVIAWLPGSGLDVRHKEGDSQVVTNTRLGMSGYRCQRFVRAHQVLDANPDASLEFIADVLGAIEQRGPGAFTSYSTVYDLKNRNVYVYNLANFEEVVEFNLDLELEKNRRRVHKLEDLFESSPSIESIRELEQRLIWDTRVTLDDSVLTRYEGRYSPAEGIVVEIKRDTAGGLTVQNPGQPDATLFPESETLFRIAPDRGQVSFRVGEDGNVIGLTLHKQADVFAARVE